MTVIKIPPIPSGIKKARTASEIKGTVAKPKKKFKVESCQNEGRGEGVILYADSGMGKTTLAALLEKNVFISLDGGVYDIKHPVTGEPLKHIPGIESFQDVRDTLQTPELFEDYDFITIDHITLLEQLTTEHVVAYIPTDKGRYVKNIEGYGWKIGYRHLYDTFKLFLQDCDNLKRRGKNIILIAQNGITNVPNPGGADFLRDGPRLYTGKPSNQAQTVEWAGHVFRIGYKDINVEEKKASGSTERAVFVQPEVYFIAKSRTIDIEYPVVSFENPQDNSIWEFLFEDE